MPTNNIAQTPLESFLIKFFQELDGNKVAFIILRNYSYLPEKIRPGGDIDLLVDFKNLEKTANIVSLISDEQNFKVVQCFHGSGWLEIRIADINPELFALQLHIHGEESRLGMPILNSEKILSRRQPYKNFFIPHPVDEAMLSWFTRVLVHGKGKAQYRDQIVSAVKQYPKLAQEVLTETFGYKLGRRLFEAFQNNNPEYSEQIYQKLNRAIILNALKKGPSQWVTILKRILTAVKWRIPPVPYGLTLVILGPDGAGKSTIADEVFEALSHLFLIGPPLRLHLRPGFLPPLADLPHPSRWVNRPSSSMPVTDPHGAKPSGTAFSLARLLYYAADYILGYHLKVFPRARWRRSMVMFERYYYDYIVDPRRSRINLPPWVAKSLLPLIPRPDLVFYLDAPAEVILARKQEVPPAEVERQIKAYRQLMAELPNSHVIDANRPIETVAKEIIEKVIETLGDRVVGDRRQGNNGGG